MHINNLDTSIVSKISIFSDDTKHYHRPRNTANITELYKKTSIICRVGKQVADERQLQNIIIIIIIIEKNWGNAKPGDRHPISPMIAS